MGRISTYTGGDIDVESPLPSDIHVMDIAIGLSNICRFGGQCRPHYSVARHALSMADYCLHMGWSPDDQYLALHHDDSEAYIGDMVRPLKYVPGIKFYRAIEDRWMRAIGSALGFPWPLPLWLKELDSEFCATELVELKRNPSVYASWPPDVVEAEYMLVHKKLLKEIASGKESSQVRAGATA